MLRIQLIQIPREILTCSHISGEGIREGDRPGQGAADPVLSQLQQVPLRNFTGWQNAGEKILTGILAHRKVQ